MRIAPSLNVCSRCAAKTVPYIGTTTINVAAGNPVSYQVPQYELPDPGRYTYSTLPTGLSFNQSTGTLSGTITSTSIATYTINLTASNVRGTGAGVLIINVLNVRVKVNFRKLSPSGTDPIFGTLQVSFDGSPYANVTSIGNGSSPGTMYQALHQIKWKMTYAATGSFTYSQFQSQYDIDVALPSGAITLLTGSQATCTGSILAFDSVSGNSISCNIFNSLVTTTGGGGILNTSVGGLVYGINGGYNNATIHTPGAITQSVPYSLSSSLVGKILTAETLSSGNVLELGASDGTGSYNLGYNAVGSPAQTCVSEMILNF